VIKLTGEEKDKEQGLAHDRFFAEGQLGSERGMGSGDHSTAECGGVPFLRMYHPISVENIDII